MRPLAFIRREYPPTAGAVCGDQKFDELLESIRRHGIREPITLDRRGLVLDGHHRLEAARMLGMSSVPVRVWTGSDYVS